MGNPTKEMIFNCCQRDLGFHKVRLNRLGCGQPSHNGLRGRQTNAVQRKTSEIQEQILQQGNWKAQEPIGEECQV